MVVVESYGKPARISTNSPVGRRDAVYLQTKSRRLFVSGAGFREANERATLVLGDAATIEARLRQL